MARIAAFLFALAWARGVDAAIENPPGNCIWMFPPLKGILGGINSTLELAEAATHRCAFDPLPPGERYWKKSRFVGTAGWINETCRPCSCGTAGHEELAHNWIGKDCLKKVTGHSADLTASNAYPDTLGETIVATWHGSRLAPGGTEFKPPSNNPWQHASSEDEESAQTAAPKPKEAAASTQTQSWCQCHGEDKMDAHTHSWRHQMRDSWHQGHSKDEGNSQHSSQTAPLKRRSLSWEQCSSQDEDTKPVASKPRTRGVPASRYSSQHVWQRCSSVSGVIVEVARFWESRRSSSP